MPSAPGTWKVFALLHIPWKEPMAGEGQFPHPPPLPGLARGLPLEQAGKCGAAPGGAMEETLPAELSVRAPSGCPHQVQPMVASLVVRVHLHMLPAVRTCHPSAPFFSQTGAKLSKILPCALKGN